MKKIIAVCFAITICAFSGFAYAASNGSQSLGDIQILRISGQDQRAVMKDKDGKMKIIKTGDVLRAASGELRVVEITSGRVVLEQKTGNDTEKLIIRLVNGQQKIERMRNIAQLGAPRLAPVHQIPKIQQ